MAAYPSSLFGRRLYARKREEDPLAGTGLQELTFDFCSAETRLAYVRSTVCMHHEATNMTMFTIYIYIHSP